MKKRERRSFFEVISSVFNFRMWMGAETAQMFWRQIVTALKRMFVPNAKLSEKENLETFEDAQARLAVSDDTLKLREKALMRTSLLLCVAALLLFLYALFQLVYGGFHAFLLTLSLTGLACVMAFRYHFWAFQIKERKLGCSIREWYRYGLRGEKR